MLSKKDLSERDICTKYITPALSAAGWDIKIQIREEVSFTAGRIYVRGKLHKRGKQKRADYILYYKQNIPIAIIEAKDNNHSVKAGIQQALDYAKILDIPNVYSSNGDAFHEHDRSGSTGRIEQELPLIAFPTPEELWKRYKKYKGLDDTDQEIAKEDYHIDSTGRTPRYYQQIAINRSVEAIAKGQDRILLVMATGTGKTYVAFQIIWRLWKSRKKKRILFLADRNALVDQTKRGDFKHFKDKLTVIRKHTIDKSYEIYLSLYQGLTNYNEDKDAYKEFSRDFFDLVVIDECHRGSADEASAWREILDYFHNATHIGLTATPKETEDVSNIAYFGDPVYTYSLKQGIQDGFLAPYKVVKIALDRDLEGWRPELGKTDKEGELVEDRIYNQKDFDKNLVIDERTELVAKKVTEYLKGTNRFDKSIIFCVDIDHAERMRSALANKNADLVKENHKYIMQITGDNIEGKRELDNFINPEERYPVIATTSKLMTTGIDAQTCKLIVLDKIIRSMTEFKQIIGRGTRINEDFGKYYFTIMDFRNATDLFSDPDFDGEPVSIYKPQDDDPVIPEDEYYPEINENDPDLVFEDPLAHDTDMQEETRRKIYVNKVLVTVVNERVQYIDANGKLITESTKDYTRKKVNENYKSLNDFLNKWQSSDKKKVIIEELEAQGVIFDALYEDVGKDFDPFDIICHTAFDMPPLTRKERANNVKKRNYFTKYGEQARKVMESLLDKYSDEGVENIESIEVLKLNPLNHFGSPIEIVKLFGGKKKYEQAIKELESELYRTA